MTREDVYAYLEELEPPERLMKQLYQNHQAISVENGLNGLSEGQNAQYMKRADEYKPHLWNRRIIPWKASPAS